MVKIIFLENCPFSGFGDLNASVGSPQTDSRQEDEGRINRTVRPNWIRHTLRAIRHFPAACLDRQGSLQIRVTTSS